MAFLPLLGPAKDERYRNGWAEKDSQDNLLATAAHAAETGKKHVVTGVYAAYSATTNGALLQIKDATTVIFETYVYDHVEIEGLELVGTAGNAVSAELAASGGVGTIGKVNLTGYTVSR